MTIKFQNVLSLYGRKNVPTPKKIQNFNITFKSHTTYFFKIAGNVLGFSKEHSWRKLKNTCQRSYVQGIMKHI